MINTIVILFGGPGEEHEISIRSASNVIENIDSKKYFVNKVFVDKNGVWYFDEKRMNYRDILTRFDEKKTLFWPIFHGPFGEGGEVQKILESLKLEYVGSNSKTSKLAMNKLETQKVLAKSGILVPKTFKLFKNIKFNLEKIKTYPVILKPIDSGSSVDLYKCNSQKELERSIIKISKNNPKFLLQEFVNGREFTCGVINKGSKVIALPPTEIILKGSGTFDYKAKYTPGACLEVTPAKISKKDTLRIKKMAIKAHEILKCRDISRTDLILDPKGNLVVLETNTIPGMTKTSFIPAQLNAKKISFNKFVDIIYKNHFIKS